MNLRDPELLLEMRPADRALLQRELLALYHECQLDINCATSMQADAWRQVQEAAAVRQSATDRMAAIRSLLDAEFPGWQGR
ncbi:MAG TPA: hypothetical protein VLH79_10745 [Chthonomonadales bacterium]|nr:hypothetical protein [Chthonomonadales bacterium]